MNKGEAMKYFKKYLAIPCRTCKAPVGELCDTPAVWIHFARMIDIWKEKGQKHADSGQ